MSFLEVSASTVVGLSVAYLTQLLVFPTFDIHIPHSSHVLITAIFTAVSIVRGFAVRRLFNWIGS